jgi:DNA-binding CsgD family transcriptional regulator
MAKLSPVSRRATALTGRRSERDVLDRLIDAVGAGESSALVLRGEPGVGKTALLEYVVEQASGFRVVRAAGVQSEMELAFAGLHQLLAPMLDRLEGLPALQSEALRTAFGLAYGRPPDRFFVGLAVLSLLSDVAEEQPLLCVVDDEQWLDRGSADVLAFVARRLGAESVGLIFAARAGTDDLAGLPELVVGELSDVDAGALLDSMLTAPLDPRVREQIISETRGIPLALMEVLRDLTPAELPGGFGLTGGASVSGSIEETFRRRIDALPSDSRRLLQLAAADPIGDPVLVRRAADRLGIPTDAATAPAEVGLLEFGARVRFRHPLVRSAAYGSASLQERQEAHRALAEMTDREIDPDRHAWHRAHAAPGPDEDVAEELERAAARAQARGGFTAAAAFLERSAELTLEPARRAQRSLVAAQTTFRAGAVDDALGMLSATEAGALDELDRAQVELLRAQIAFVSTHGSDAPTMLLNAARRLAPLSPELASETYLEALSAAMFAGRLAVPGASVLDVSLVAKAAPGSPVRRGQDLLLEGFASLFSESYGAAVPLLRRAQKAFDSSGPPASEQLRWMWLASISAVLLWDDLLWEATSERYVQIARETGALVELPHALSMRIYVHLFAGELTTAASLVEEIRAATFATGSNLAPYGAVGLAALHGREAEAVRLIEDARADVTRRGEGIGLSVLDWAEAALYNGLGRYKEACAAAVRVTEHPDDLGSSNWWMSELIEAAVRAGTPELAADARLRLAKMAGLSGTDWARGIAARSEALFANEAPAEELYIEAIERLGRTQMAVDLARAHLLYGEWLRRHRRRLDARTELRVAYDGFSAFGMEAFADRARRELLATGETVRKRRVETRGDLTAQEAQIARLAHDGLTNPEIGAQLFISPRTVQYHLRKVFLKLGINSRAELDRVLPGDPVAPSL